MTTWPLHELVPHADAMILLDEVLECDEESILCRRRLTPGGLFQQADGSLPAWVGVELMAQAVAAWAGIQARRHDQPVQLGFLLGSRHYQSNAAVFAGGSELLVHAERSFHDDQGMGVFAGRIQAPGIDAQARLTVFSPPDAAAFMASVSAESSR